jgi:hypothetical protein
MSSGAFAKLMLDRLASLTEVPPALVVDRDCWTRPHEGAELHRVFGGHRVAHGARDGELDTAEMEEGDYWKALHSQGFLLERPA